MEEKYYINGNKKHGGHTWNSILQYCFDQINSKESRKFWNWKDGWDYRPGVKAYDHAKFNHFFADYRHHNNDWAYWTEGQYERIFVGFDEDGRTKLYVNGAWIPPTYVVPTKGWYVEDSFGRIIPSGYIKACLLNFKPVVKEDKPYRRRSWGYYNKLWDYERDFRKGPVPGRGGYRKWCGRRYKGDHGGFGMEARSSAGFVHDLKHDEELSQYKIKYNRGRAHFAEMCYTDWDELHWHNKGVGWKRTRKRKQWM